MPKTILVVDDSETVRQQVRIALSKSGFHVVEAPNGKAALHHARQRSFDLVIADYLMPEMNGLEFSTALRALPDYAHTPVFMLTTEQMDTRQEKASRAGITAWVVKPFEPKKMLQAIEFALSNPKGEAKQ